MRQFAAAYFATVIPLFILDFIWLTLAGDPVYRANLGPLMRAQPDLAVAAGFYLIYAAGLVTFAVLPALERRAWQKALGLGAFLGLVAYGTYDLTNQATIAGWPVIVTVIDLAWGTAVSAVTCAIAYFILKKLVKQ